MIRLELRLTSLHTLAALALLTGLAALSPALRAQSATDAATPNPAIFKTAGSVGYAGNFKHYSADDAMTHGYLALSLSPSGHVTGTLTWHGSRDALPLKGKMDVATGQGHFSLRDADGKKLADAVRIPFLVSQYGLTLNGGGATGNGESTSFFLTRHYDYSGGYGSAGGATLTLGGSNTYTGSSTINVGAVGSLTVNTGAVNIGAGSATLGGSVVTTGTGTLTLTGSTLLNAGTIGNGIITENSAGVAVVDGDLTYNGSVLLHGPLTTTINANGTTDYTGTDANGKSATVTVISSTTISTGG